MRQSKQQLEQQLWQILDLLAGDLELRSKRELIEKFIEEHLPNITDVVSIPNPFEQYWSDQRLPKI